VINLWRDNSNSGYETAVGSKKYVYYFSHKKHMIGDGI
jgi:hypothetical protein